MQNSYQDTYTETPAGQGKRLINFVVDMVAFFGIWMLISFIAMFIGMVFNYSPTYADEKGEEVPLLPMIIIVPVFWGYYVICEYAFQRTLGKLFTKTKVVNENDVKPTFKQVVIRTISRSIPFEYLSFLATSNGIHDRLSKTKVVEL